MTLLSASMIVRDAEESLPRTLLSLAGLVDEVVVYDTGSTDRTLEVARERAEQAGLNLVLLEGYWDDDFSRARNASLQGCSGEWILVVDADEEAVCDDPGQLRSSLVEKFQGVAGRPGAGTGHGGHPASEAFEILISDLRWSGGHRAAGWRSVRIFRRKACRWRGALHEQIVLRDSGDLPRGGFLEGLELLHRGYGQRALDAGDKVRRNLRIAERAVNGLGAGAADPGSVAHAWISYGRALTSAGRGSEAADAFARGLTSGGAVDPVQERFARESITRWAIDQDLWATVSDQLAHLWRVCEVPTLPVVLAARSGLHRAVRAAEPGPQGEFLRIALDTTGLVPPGSPDDTGADTLGDEALGISAAALVALGEPLRAASLLADGLAERVPCGGLLPCLDQLVTLGRSPTDIAELFPPWLLGELIEGIGAEDERVGPRDAWIDALAARWPDEERLPHLPDGGGSGPPLLSAAMIVKDEEANLPACLASLSGLVDQVVIYDTGSTDRTLAVARECAAQTGLNLRMVEGYWDEDFSRARNESLEWCGGEWILWIDADEVAVCDDPPALRRLLASLAAVVPNGAGAETTGDPDALQIAVVGVAASAGSSPEQGLNTRLFRRERCHWAGRFQEQIRRRGDGSPVRSAATPLMQLSHRGYLASEVRGRHKAERNLRIAEAAVAHLDSDPFPAHTLVSYGRALAGAGRLDDALTAFGRALGVEEIPPVAERYAQEGVVRVGLEAGRLEEAGRGLDALWRCCDYPALPLYLSTIFMLAGEGRSRDRRTLESALARASALAPLAEDDNGTAYGPDRWGSLQAEALEALGRRYEAASAVQQSLVTGYIATELTKMLQLTESDDAVTTIAETTPPWLLKPMLAETTTLDARSAGEMLEALIARWPDETAIAVVGSQMIDGLPDEAREHFRRRLSGQPS